MGCFGINFVKIQKPLLTKLLKWGGVEPKLIEIEKGTTLNCWVPLDKSKPPLILIHGFAAEGGVTWQFQVGALSKEYSVYVPDLLFFGRSKTEKEERTEVLQANCVMKMLRLLGVERCAVVGFSYGGMVAFKMAELYPELVRCLIVSGTTIPMNHNISQDALNRIGFKDSAELLLPTSVKGLKGLFKVACYKKIRFPDCLYKDFLEAMFENRKERGELLAALVESNREAQVPKISQKILLVWGCEDEIFNVERAERMKEELGDNAELVLIEKAGHLLQLERPCMYNRAVLEYLRRNFNDIFPLEKRTY